MLTKPLRKPEREVTANNLSSHRKPNIRIELPTTVRYVGAERWPLYDVADCELHLFVDADAHNLVQRFYWIQFEGYLPTHPEYQYDYSADQPHTLAGGDFHINVNFGTTGGAPKPGSDGECVLRLLHVHGYKQPAGMLYARFVHLIDKQKS